MGRPMTYDEVMRRSAPQRSACEFDSLSDEADDSDSGDERAVPRRVSPPPSPKTYDEALLPPAYVAAAKRRGGSSKLPAAPKL